MLGTQRELNSRKQDHNLLCYHYTMGTMIVFKF